MLNRPPCIAWAEKLTLRYEDLSRLIKRPSTPISPPVLPAGQPWPTIIFSMPICALPPPLIKPLPRLSFPISGTEDEAQGDGRTEPTRQRSDARQNASPGTSFAAPLKKALAVVLIACLISTLLLFFGGRAINTSVAHQPGALLLTYDRRSDFVDAVAWSPDGRYIASGSWDHTVQVWDVLQRTRHPTYTGHNGLVTTLAWSPDSTRIASGSWDDTMQVWEVQAGRLLHTYPYNEAVNAVPGRPMAALLPLGEKMSTCIS